MEVGDFLGDSVLLVRTEVKRSWAMLLTANVPSNFVKYMLFTVAYNIKKKERKKKNKKPTLTGSQWLERIDKHSTSKTNFYMEGKGR